MEGPPPCPNLRASKILSFALALFAGSVVYALVGSWIELSLVNDVIAGKAIHANTSFEIERRATITQFVQIVVWLACFVAFLIYVKRSAEVANDCGSQGVQYSPGRALLYCFLPISNLICPYLALQESWKATDPDADAHSWSSSKSSKLIAAWWVLWVVLSVWNRWEERAPTDLENIHSQSNAIYGHLALQVASLLLALTALLAIRALTMRCQAKWEAHHGAKAPSAVVESE